MSLRFFFYRKSKRIWDTGGNSRLRISNLRDLPAIAESPNPITSPVGRLKAGIYTGARALSSFKKGGKWDTVVGAGWAPVADGGIVELHPPKVGGEYYTGLKGRCPRED